MNDFYQLAPGTILELNLNEKDQFVNPKLYKWWKLKEKPYSMEGIENQEWVLIDYVDVVVHIFQREIREFYDIENLWGDAKIINVELKA